MAHSHDHAHRDLWLVDRPVAHPGGRRVHRIGRRRFLTELGRNTVAIAVLGGVVAACSDGDDTPGATPRSDAGPAGDTDEGLRWAQASLGFVSAYVLVRGNEAAVVDTGSTGSADQIGEALATLGATYDDVGHVILTHSHPDHVGSLSEVLDRSPSAMAYAGQDDLTDITVPEVAITALNDGDDVFGLQVVHTPGHTPGSISVFDPGIGLLVAGDALTGGADGGLAGPNEQFTPDMATAGESVAKLAALDVEAVAMGHGEPVTSGAGPLLAALASEI